MQIKNTAAYIMHHYTLGHDWLQLSISLCGNSLPIHPATPYSSCHGDSLPPRAFSATSSVVTMATAAWPWVCCCCRLDLNSSAHPRRAGTHDLGNWLASHCCQSRRFGCPWKRQYAAVTDQWTRPCVISRNSWVCDVISCISAPQVYSVAFGRAVIKIRCR